MKHVGIIGGGGISETHARAASTIDGVTVSAVYGRNFERVSRLAHKFDASAYADFDKFLTHQPLHLVIIGSPSGLHASQGIKSAEHGLHVLVEKPIDVTVEKGEALVAACERAGLQLAVCYQDRFAPDIVRLKELIDEGALGQLILVSGHVRWYRPPNYYDSDWRASDRLAGGGALMSQAIHTVDSLLWLAGDVAGVSARMKTALHQIEVEDTLVATMEFDSGALGSLEASTSAYPGYDRRIEISGSEGTAIIERERLVRCDLRSGVVAVAPKSALDTNLSSSSPIISDVSGHKRIIEDFIGAIDGKNRPRCDGRDGLRSVKVVHEMYESARTAQSLRSK